VNSAKDSGSASLKYPKPKILLIDLPEETEGILRTDGYNVTTGSFGTPYKVKKSDNLYPVITNGNLPFNVSEQEVVVINLLITTILDGPKGDKETPDSEDDWWASCNLGLIDPRQKLIASVRDDFNRIYLHGGLFIVLSSPHVLQKTMVGRIVREYGSEFNKTEDIYFNIWSFLDITHNLNVNPGQGEEVIINESPFSQILSEYIERVVFLCTFNSDERWESYSKYNWIPLALTKFRETVAAAIVSKNQKGSILIFPQLRDKPHFVSKLLKEILPDFCPHLFPFAEGMIWNQKLEYEHPKVLELKAKMEEVHEEAKRQVGALEQAIEEERAAMRFLHDLITGTDRTLVKAVKKTLEVLGFKQVIDVDEEMEKKGKTGQKGEDLRILDDSPILLVEVKGIAGLPKDAAALQSLKYLAPRMKEWSRTDIQALSIINHQRNLPPLERDNTTTFRGDILTNAEEHGFGLLTTWDLFRLTRGYLKNGWKYEHIKPLFYKHGRIKPIPGHYEFLGKVESFWQKAGAVGVRLTAARLNLGDLISFECPVEFEEQKVESLQVENTQVTLAEVGNLAGIRPIFP